MANTDLIYGDRAALATLPTGRPAVLFVVGDSISDKFVVPFALRIKGIVGYDNWLANNYHLGGGLTPPTSPGAYVARYATFLTYAHTGTGTTTGATSIGATSIPISLASGGLPDITMPIVVGSGANIETTYVNPATWTGNGAATLISPLLVSPALVNAHASGSPISWQRPSGQTAHWPGNAMEITFATAASPQSATWINDRLVDGIGLGETIAAYGDPIEGVLFADGFCLNRYAIDIILFYWKLPANSGAPNLRLYGRSAEATPQQATVDFSIYAATPTIAAVKVTIPAPVTYLNTVSHRWTVNSPNVGNFTAGMVFAPISVVAVRSGATAGTVVMSATTGGAQFGDILGDPTRYGPQWSLAMRQQFIAAMATTPLKNIDQLMVHYGHNNPPATAALMFANIQQISADMKAANSAANTIYISDYANPTDTASGANASMSGACQLIEGQSQIVGFDQAGMTDVTAADINTYYLSDGVHPNTTGKAFVANRIANFYQAAGYGGASNVLQSIRTTAGTGSQVSIPSNANAGVCQAVGYVYDANDNPLVGEIVEYRINAGNGVNTAIINRRVHQATSGANGLVTISMLKGYTYGVRYDQGDFIDFPVPASGATCSLSQVLGRMGS